MHTTRANAVRAFCVPWKAPDAPSITLRLLEGERLSRGLPLLAQVVRVEEGCLCFIASLSLTGTSLNLEPNTRCLELYAYASPERTSLS